MSKTKYQLHLTKDDHAEFSQFVQETGEQNLATFFRKAAKFYMRKQRELYGKPVTKEDFE